MTAGLAHDSSTPSLHQHHKYKVLAIFAALSFANAVLLMDYADDYTLVTHALQADATAVAFLYTLFLLCVMPAMLLASVGVASHETATMLCGHVLNIVGAWLRYQAVVDRSYAVAIASTVSAGAAASVIVCSYGAIAKRWFPPAQRSLATSVAVQSNYLGWAMGSLIGFAVRGSLANFRGFLFWQAVCISTTLPVFLIVYYGLPFSAASGGGPPPQPQRHSTEADSAALVATAAEDDDSDGTQLTARESLWTMAHNWRYGAYALCYAVVGGIGFSVPAAQDAVLGETCMGSELAYSTDQTTLTNFAFILSGVLTGLLLGVRVRRPHMYEPTCLALALMGSVTITALAILSRPDALKRFGRDEVYPVVVLLMSLSGVSSVGFIGLALNFAMALGAPVSAAFTVGGVEWLIQGFGGGLSTLSANCSVGFYGCASFSWAATLLLAVLWRFSRRGASQEPLMCEDVVSVLSGT